MTDRKSEIINHILKDAKFLLDEHFEKIENYAAETPDDGDKPVKAKVGLRIEWEAGAQRPRIKVKLGTTLSLKDETDGVCEMGQEIIDFEKFEANK